MADYIDDLSFTHHYALFLSIDKITTEITLRSRRVSWELSIPLITKITTGSFSQIINDSLKIHDIFIFDLCLK